jgi:hypothetical protein
MKGAMARSFLPNHQNELLLWSSAFSAGISAMGESIGIDPQQQADYAQLHAQYAAALSAALAPDSRTRGSVTTKNLARAALKLEARRLARIVNAHPSVTDQQRANLGLSMRGGGGASPAIHSPDEVPLVVILATSGRIVRVQLCRLGSIRRGRPPTAQGATIFTFVGDAPPIPPMGWSFVRNTSRTSLDIVIGPSVPPGSQVWVAASWYSPRGDNGPMSLPVSTYIGAGVVSMSHGVKSMAA